MVGGQGRSAARRGLGLTGVLDAELPRALGGPPPYARWGDWSLLLLAAVGAGLLLRGRRISA